MAACTTGTLPEGCISPHGDREARRADRNTGLVGDVAGRGEGHGGLPCTAGGSRRRLHDPVVPDRDRVACRIDRNPRFFWAATDIHRG